MMGEIHEVLRSMDRTAIFRLVKTIYGEVDYRMVYNFVYRYGPTKKIRNYAYDIAYFHLRRHYYEYDEQYLEFEKSFKYHIAMSWFRYFIKKPNSPYTKRPIMGNTHLYFASPVYLHDDYNKWLCMPIAGNERFCETICKLADKYFPKYENNNNKQAERHSNTYKKADKEFYDKLRKEIEES